ncbi:MAG: apolipoprotein N-acyltransferase [Clostridiales bacterium]|nr:apolipoprotein N-acyltransferase [Clostridiales bacterium]
MKIENINNKKSFCFAMCAFSGTLLAISYMFESLFWLVFFGAIPLLLVFLKNNTLNKRRIILYMLTFSLSFYGITLYWMYLLSPYINQSKVKSILILTLSIIFIGLVIALYWIIACAFYHKIKRNDALDIIIFSLLYIFGEWLQGIFYPLAFPWARLANIVSPLTYFIQSASLFGSLFISFLILLINGFIAYSILNVKTPNKCYTYLAVSIAVFIINMGYGILRFKNIEEENKNYNATIIQGNFAGLEKWAVSSDEVFNLYIDTTKKSITDKTDVVLFPETAIPFDIFQHDEKFNIILNLVQEYDITLIFGYIHYKDDIKYNSMIAIKPNGEVSDIYSKQLLVPMGEMIPFEFILSKFIPGTFLESTPYTQGTECMVLQTDFAKFGGVICFESIFPTISRKTVKLDADVIAILSNDSWFGRTPALYQHHSHAILRAVENKRYVLRCSNSAISSVISPYGKVEKVAPKYELSVLNASFNTSNDRTLYSYIGDIIVMPAAALFILGIVKKKKK